MVVNTEILYPLLLSYGVELKVNRSKPHAVFSKQSVPFRCVIEIN